MAKYVIKQLVYPLVLISLLIISSCSNKEQISFNLHFKDSTYKNAILYSYLGDRKIVVDTLYSNNGVFSYNIDSCCNVGVYQLLFDNGTFLEFIYNNERIVLETNMADVNNYKVIQSTENKLFKNFTKNTNDYYYFSEEQRKKLESLSKLNDSIAIENIFIESKNRFDNIINIFNDKGSQHTFAYSIARLLHRPQFSFASLKNPEIDEKQFLTDYYLNGAPFDDERLLATPYFYMLTKQYLEETINIEDSSFTNKALDNLIEKTSKNKIVSGFTRELLTNVLMKNNKTNVLKNTIENNFKESSCISLGLLNNDLKYKELSIGTNVNECFKDTNIINDVKQYNHTILYFYNSTCEKSNEALNLLNEKDSTYSTNNIGIILLDEEDSSIKGTFRRFNTSSVPEILIIDKDFYITSRIIGSKNILYYIRSLQY